MADGSCEYDCPHLAGDKLAEEMALGFGDNDLAESIRREAADRRLRCASVAGGAVRLAGGELGCGLEHADPQFGAGIALGIESALINRI